MNEIYSHVEPGKSVIDIGTDHGLIPLKLFIEKDCKVCLCDISKKALDKAVINASEFGICIDIQDAYDKRLDEDGFEFVVQDGFICEANAKNLGKDKKIFDIGIIAGMGGETIADILNMALLTGRLSKGLILQPRSKSELLKKFLIKNGFSDIKESFAFENDTVWEIIESTAPSV